MPPVLGPRRRRPAACGRGPAPAAPPSRRRTARAATPRGPPAAPRPAHARRPSRTGRSIRQRLHRRFGLGDRRADEDALAGGQPVGLDHDVAVGVGDRHLRGRGGVAHREALRSAPSRRPSPTWRRPSTPRAARPPRPDRTRRSRRPRAGRRGRRPAAPQARRRPGRPPASRPARSGPRGRPTATSCSVATPPIPGLPGAACSSPSRRRTRQPPRECVLAPAGSNE